MLELVVLKLVLLKLVELLPVKHILIRLLRDLHGGLGTSDGQQLPERDISAVPLAYHALTPVVLHQALLMRPKLADVEAVHLLVGVWVGLHVTHQRPSQQGLSCGELH